MQRREAEAEEKYCRRNTEAKLCLTSELYIYGWNEIMWAPLQKVNSFSLHLLEREAEEKKAEKEMPQKRNLFEEKL